MKYGLIGKKLGHSYSPQLHALFGDPDYRLVELAEREVGDFVTKGAFCGLNVTIPYKETVIPFLQDISPEAARIGSVNTIVRDARGLHGYNTDYFGFAALLRRSGIDPAGKKCLVLGSGGSSRTVCTVLTDLGAACVTLISRSGENNYGNLDRHRDAALLVNTTPVGMYPQNGAAPLSLDGFDALEAVADIIYNPARTALLLEAEKRGIKTAGGLPMLAFQAKYARELFDGAPIPDSRAEDAIAALERQMRSIVLVGMPGCGKSTVGELLAQRLGRPFWDTDALYEQKYGVTPAQAILGGGEPAFRRAESSIVADISRQSGAAISCGGGSVLSAQNRDALRQNSYVIWLQRDPAQLCREDRPLSSGEDALRQLAQQRTPLYRAICDASVSNDAAPEDAVKSILEVLGYENSDC